MSNSLEVKQMKKYTENRSYQDITMSVTIHRDRKGCDYCKKDHPTEAFIGFRGNVLWLCSKGLEELTKIKLP